MKDIVRLLNENGYEAYIVGGYVRDYLLGIPSNDIDICTNAPIDKIMKIFKGRGRAFKEYYSYHIEEDGYTYDITTFRKELRYRKNKPVEITVAKDLGTDLLRRDFTINTFAIDNADRLVDVLGAKKDLDSRLIRVVGDTEKKLTEDKTRIIRAIRFACTLDFDLDPEIIKFISNKKIYLLNEVPGEYKRKELDKIFESNNADKFFYLVSRYNMGKYFNISYDNNIIKTYDKYGIWAQIETDLPFTNKEKNIIKSIRNIVKDRNITLDEVKNYDKQILYNAASILKLDEKVMILEDIIKLHSIIDIDLSIDEMLEYVDIRDLKKTYKFVERRIMEGLLTNNKEEIIDFIRKI